jgi:DNA-binding CsgD family transcriptional regulator
MLVECADCGQLFHTDEDMLRHNGQDGCPTNKRINELYAETGLSLRQSHAYALYEDGYTESETAALMDLETGTVRIHLQRARDKIKQAEKTVEALEETKEAKDG